MSLARTIVTGLQSRLLDMNEGYGYSDDMGAVTIGPATKDGGKKPWVILDIDTMAGPEPGTFMEQSTSQQMQGGLIIPGKVILREPSMGAGEDYLSGWDHLQSILDVVSYEHITTGKTETVERTATRSGAVVTVTGETFQTLGVSPPNVSMRLEDGDGIEEIAISSVDSEEQVTLSRTPSVVGTTGLTYGVLRFDNGQGIVSAVDCVISAKALAAGVMKEDQEVASAGLTSDVMFIVSFFEFIGRLGRN